MSTKDVSSHMSTYLSIAIPYMIISYLYCYHCKFYLYVHNIGDVHKCQCQGHPDFEFGHSGQKNAWHSGTTCLG